MQPPQRMPVASGTDALFGVCERWSEVQGSVESREACITPTEVDKAHQWPIYSTVQYQASSPPANTQWRHERVLVCLSFTPIKTKLARSSKNFLHRKPLMPPWLLPIQYGDIIQVRICHIMPQEFSYFSVVVVEKREQKPQKRRTDQKKKKKKRILYLGSDIFKCCSQAQAESILLLHLTIFM